MQLCCDALCARGVSGDCERGFTDSHDDPLDVLLFGRWLVLTRLKLEADCFHEVVYTVEAGLYGVRGFDGSVVIYVVHHG